MNTQLPIIKCPDAAKYGFKTKLVLVTMDGKEFAYQEEHHLSRATEIKRDSAEALRAKGYRVPHADVDTISEQWGVYG